jgi:plasmid stabilization system protein ParE
LDGPTIRTLEERAMPQKAWTDKRERQYEHIKDSYEDRGVSEDEAEERAARTVNKERPEQGETKSRGSKRS